VIVLASLFLTGCIGLDPLGAGDDTAGGGGDSGPAFTTYGGMSFPSRVDFGSVQLDSPAATNLTLTNSSGGNVRIEQVVLSAPAAFDAQFTSVPWVVGSGGQYVISLSFDPSTAGVQSGTLSFGVEGETGLADIAITGEGVTQGGDGGSGDGGGSDGGSSADSLDFSDTTVAFGNVPLESTQTSNVIIENHTGADVRISDITSSNAVLTTTGVDTPAVVSDGSSKTLQVKFTPTEERAYTESLTVRSDHGDTTISVTGTGEYHCTVCGPQLDVDTGGDSHSMDFTSLLGIADTKTIYLFNTGDEDLTVSTVRITNDTVGGGTFTSHFTGPVTVHPGGSSSFTLSYSCPDIICVDFPNDAFDWNIAHIASNDPASPDWTIQLNGT